MEKELNELLLHLFPLIDPMKIIAAGQSTEYFEKIKEYYEYLPSMTQAQVLKQCDSFLCCKCKKYLIAKEFTCGHKICSTCFKESSFSSTCLCNAGQIKLSPEDQEKQSKGSLCLNCLKSCNNLDLNCNHFCQECIKYFYLQNSKYCFVCHNPFKVYESIGICTKCFKSDVKVVYSCDFHAHCSECANIDLYYMACQECQIEIDISRLSKIVGFVKPECNHCGNRMKCDVVWTMNCCGKNFCYFCLGKSQNCYCGKRNDFFENLRGYDEYARQFLNDFRNIERW